MKKVNESLKQTERDLEMFFTIFPDLTTDDLNRINFITLSILPATLATKLNICDSCYQLILFREDLNPEFKECGSLCKNLMEDLSHQASKFGNESSLHRKLQIYNLPPPSRKSLNILKIISARLVGLGSLYFPKVYGPTKSFHGANAGMLDEVNDVVNKNLEEALFLSSVQVQALNSFNFVITGFYGSGKTTGIDVAIDKIVERPIEYDNPMILFVTWDQSEGLRKIFEDKFSRMRDQNPHLKENDCLEVSSLAEALKKFQVRPIQSEGWAWLSSLFGIDRTKVDVLNDLCGKLKGTLWNVDCQ